MSKSFILTKKWRIRAGAWRGKSQLHSEGRWIPGRRVRAGGKSLPRRSRRKHERMSGSKNSPEGTGKYLFYSKYGET